MPVFLADLINPFYQAAGNLAPAAYVRGQFFRVHLGYTRENLELWRPAGTDASQTRAAAFRLVAAPGDAFSRPLPLHDPRLETNEEFVAVRAKRRPVILLSRAPAPPGLAPVRGGGQVYRRLALVVPVYSLTNRHTGTLKYRPEFVERMQVLEWPEFLYLPPVAGVLPSPSFARVSEMQAVYEPHLVPLDLRLVDETLQVLQDQVRYLTTGKYEGALASYREELLHQ